MIRISVAAAVATVAVVHSSPALAGPNFGYVYTAGVEEPGETELGLWATDRRGKDLGHYDAQDYRLEVERGLTEHVQASLYADFASHHVRGGTLDSVNRDLAFRGLSAEFKAQLASPRGDGWGVALYAEPGWSRISKVSGEKNRELELELKAIVQKNFLADRLVWATNLTFEPEWEREREELGGMVSTSTERELGVAISTGLSYRLTPRLWVGAEGRYHSVYPDWTHGLHRENFAVNAGPSLHYDGGKWGVTATWLPQLFGGPTHAGSALELDDHERQELRVKLSYEL